MSTRGKQVTRAEPKPGRAFWRTVGPGIVVAATGVGAGDLVAAAKGGALYGHPLIWCAAAGALLKFALAESVARWQLATGTTVLEGWTLRWGKPLRWAFLAYLVIWTFVVSAALMTACGLAVHALFPAVSTQSAAAAHGAAGLVFVWIGGYRALERVMKGAVAFMFVAVVGAAVLQVPALDRASLGALLPGLPQGSTLFVMGIVGGVGGTLTLLSYNYWVREKRWIGPRWLGAVRLDLAVGYLLTGLFGVAVILLAGAVLRPRGITVSGNAGVLELAGILGERFGRAGELVFLAGFWAAVGTSLLGVWQGVPYLFVDYVELMRGRAGLGAGRAVPAAGKLYRGYALFMTFPPMLLFIVDKPVWLIVAYAALGSLFMPFLAAALLVTNNSKKAMGALRNGILSNLACLLALALFAYLAAAELWTRIFGP